jgi:TPR repeat protein
MQKARENDPETLYKIGDIYFKKREYTKAFAWFHKAALQNYPQAQAQVGYMYRDGEGISQDDQQAMDWYLKAANNGSTDAMFSIGTMYRLGYCITKNIHTAIEWYTKAANQGHSDSQCNLGWVYKDEDQVKDLQLAVNWYQKAADNNDSWAEGCVQYLNAKGYYAKEEQEGILINAILFSDLFKDN